MKTLTLHIEYLLALHDCVTLPGFGGFVLHHQEADFTKEVAIAAPRKVAGFNAGLSHNDGLMANSLMCEKGISFNEAMILIEAEVSLLHTALAQGGVVALGTVGSFRLNEGATLEFMPSTHNMFDLSMFGFESLTLEPLQKESHVAMDVAAPVADPDVVMVPLNLRVLKRLFLVASILIGVLLVSQPLEQNNVSANYASILSSHLLTKAIVPNFSLLDSSTDEAELIAMDMLVANEINEAEFSPIEVITESELVLDEPALIIQKQEAPLRKKRYYIIIGSCANETDALARIAKMGNWGYGNLSFVKKDNKYRLYISRFDDKADANRFLDQFRIENPTYSDAWLLAHVD